MSQHRVSLALVAHLVCSLGPSVAHAQESTAAPAVAELEAWVSEDPALAAELLTPEARAALSEWTDELDAPVMQSDAPLSAAPPPEPVSIPVGGDRSAATPSRVSLPDGEGSIQGLGESFSPSLSNGSLAFTLPISLPGGRAGVGAGLSLGYSSGGGASEVGYGWGLSTAAITRQSDRGLPRYDDRPLWHPGEDRFVYAGSHELVPVSNAAAAALDGGAIPSELAGWQQYRAQVEGAFMRFFRAPDSTRWVVQSPDGTRHDLGLLPPGEGPSEMVSASAASLVRGPTTGAISSWALTRTSDVHGSGVYYVYETHGGHRYLSSVYYVSPASCGVATYEGRLRCAAPLADYAVRARVVYEPRADVSVSYRTGWRVEVSRRVRRIEVTAARDAVGGRTLVRRYHLAYDARSYHSLLRSVTVEGRPEAPHSSFGVMVGDASVPEHALGDAIVGATLPPIRFSYTGDDALRTGPDGFPSMDRRVRRGAGSPAHGVGDALADLYDVNSDGLVDLLVTDPSRFRTADGGPAVGVYWNGFAGADARPASAGTFSAPTALAVPPELAGAMQLRNPNVVPMDVDGDGRSDLLHMPRVASYGYFTPVRAANDAASPAAQGWRFVHLPVSLPPGSLDPRVDLGRDAERIRQMDVNGDGLVDVLRSSGTAIQTFLNLGFVPGGEGRFGSARHDGTAWITSTDPIESCLPVAGMPITFDDAEVRFADMNGDGLEDIVRISPGSVIWLPNRGWGRFGEGEGDCAPGVSGARYVEMRSPRDLGAAFDTTYLVDLDGDGMSDLLRLGEDVAEAWMNMGGRAFSRRTWIDGLRWSRDLDRAVRFVDVDGSGTVDILFARARGWEWVDPMGGRRPRLLREVDSGLGALTTFTLGTSAEDYLRDLAAAESCAGPGCERFVWQGRDDGQCDAHVQAATGLCAIRSGGAPVVVTVVRATEVTDRLSALGVPEQRTRIEYAYHDGYYEGIEQEWRGFGATDVRSVGDSAVPTSITRSYMHQARRPRGIASDRLAENPWRALAGTTRLSETWAELGGKVLSTAHTTYLVRRLLVGLDGREVSWAIPARSDVVSYDLSTTWVPAPAGTRVPFYAGGETRDVFPAVVRELVSSDRSTTLDPDYGGWDEPVWQRGSGHFTVVASTVDVVDHAGHVLEQTAWGRVRSEYGDPFPAEEIVSHSTPVLRDAARWVWRTAETWTSGHGSTERLGHTLLEYTASHDLRATRTFATIPRAYEFAGDPDGSQGFAQVSQVLIETNRFDVWGNGTQVCAGSDIEVSQSACLRFAVIGYDAAYAQLPVSELIATSRDATGFSGLLSTSAIVDRGLGAAVRVRDFTGEWSEIGLDGLGRATYTLAPPARGCEGTSRPSTRTYYRLTTDAAGQPLSRVDQLTELDCHAPLGAVVLESRTYVDGLGRPRASLVRTDAPHAWTRSGLVRFSARGAAQTAWQPAFLDAAEPTLTAILSPSGEPIVSSHGYDAFGREVLRTAPDGARWSTSYGALAVNTCDPNDLDPANLRDYGTCATVRSDGHGRPVDTILRNRRDGDPTTLYYRLWPVWRADGALVTLERAETLDAGALGYARSRIVPGRVVARTFAVDTAGRRIASTDADTDARRSGTTVANRSWRYLWNRVGDLIAVRDPRGCGQNFYYDRGGRLLGEDYVGCAEAEPLRELGTESVPAGAIALDPIATSVRVEVRTHYDAYPAWASGDLMPASWAASVAGRVTASSDRGQRSVISYDRRGMPGVVARQMALLPAAPAAPATLSAALPSVTPSPGTPSATRLFDEAHTYVIESTYDHAGRAVTNRLPEDPDFGGGTAPEITGRLRYDQRGLPRSAWLGIDGVERPVLAEATYDRDGAMLRAVWGDDAGGTRSPTVSEMRYDIRRRPDRVWVTRAPTALPSASRELAEVTVVMDQAYAWDAADNLVAVTDHRLGREWAPGFRPQSVELRHDALYRVTGADYRYRADSGETPLDLASDYRAAMLALEDADPMRSLPAPSVAGAMANRVVSLTWDHDFLGNTTEWTDDAHAFHERSLDRITNGVTEAGDRPSAIRLATSIPSGTHAYDSSVERGGWLEVDYGDSGNVSALTVHGQCRDASPSATCADTTVALAARRSTLRAGCACAVEQHYQYRYDELAQIVDARRYDRAAGTWTLRAHLRYGFDGGQQRTVKEVRDTLGATRYAIWPFPGDFERRGLVRGVDGYEATSGTETQYLVSGARIVWQPGDPAAGLDPDHRITLAIPDLLGTSSAVIDLVSGELLEVSTYHPNGARETLRTTDRADIALEPSGFTGKEADEEVGLTYFGMRFLMPRLGRWATPDPLQIHAEGGGEALNSYHYVSGNLLQARDPIGLDGVGRIEQCKVGEPSRVDFTLAPSGPSFKAPSGGALAPTTDHGVTDEEAWAAASQCAQASSAAGAVGIAAHQFGASPRQVALTTCIAGFTENVLLLGMAALKPGRTSIIVPARVAPRVEPPLFQRPARDARPRSRVIDSTGRSVRWQSRTASSEYTVEHGSGVITTVRTDSQRRPSLVLASLTRSSLDQGSATGVNAGGIGGRAGDQAGHLIANRLGGYGGQANIVAMSAQLNNGAYKQFEAQVYDLVSAEGAATAVIRIQYTGDSSRPSSITYDVSVGGTLRLTQTFEQ